MQLIQSNQNINFTISAINRLLTKRRLSDHEKIMVFNRVNSAFAAGASPAKGFSIGLRDSKFLALREQSMGKIHTIKTLAEFNRIIANDNTFVDFYSPECKPCKTIMPKLEQMAIEYPHFVFVKVDVTTNPEIARNWAVKSVPTFAYFERNTLKLIESGTTSLIAIENMIKATMPKEVEI